MQQMRDERGKIQCNAIHDKLQQARQHVPGAPRLLFSVRYLDLGDYLGINLTIVHNLTLEIQVVQHSADDCAQ